MGRLFSEQPNQEYIRIGFWDDHCCPTRNDGSIWNKIEGNLETKKRLLAFLRRGLHFGEIEHYKGWANCRVCGKKNGSATIRYRGWKYPSGYAHYIDKHNILPPVLFIVFVLNFYDSRKRNKKWHLYK